MSYEHIIQVIATIQHQTSSRTLEDLFKGVNLRSLPVEIEREFTKKMATLLCEELDSAVCDAELP